MSRRVFIDRVVVRGTDGAEHLSRAALVAEIARALERAGALEGVHEGGELARVRVVSAPAEPIARSVGAAVVRAVRGVRR